MLADAINSELFKLWRNRSTWIWGFCFAPVVALVIGLGAVALMRFKFGDVAASMPDDIGASTIGSFGAAGLPFTLLFGLIAAAILFGGEYRWETWRLLAPRNSRTNLFLAKVVAFGVGAAFTVFAIGMAGVVASLVNSAVNHTHLTWGMPSLGVFALKLLEQFAISWIQVMQTGMVAAVVAVITRSILAAVVAPIVLGVVQFVLANQQQAGPPSPWRLLELPNLAASLLHDYVGNGMIRNQNIDASLAAQSLVSLLGWIVVAATVALVAFKRQDLAKE